MPPLVPKGNHEGDPFQETVPSEEVGRGTPQEASDTPLPATAIPRNQDQGLPQEGTVKSPAVDPKEEGTSTLDLLCKVQGDEGQEAGGHLWPHQELHLEQGLLLQPQSVLGSL